MTHRRFEPVEHSFRYPVLMPLLYLDELPELLDRHPLWSARRPAPARVSEADLLGGRDVAAEEATRELIAAELGLSPAGPVAMLAHPRYLGVGFNPLRVYFAFGVDGRAEAAVAEVTNTPWGERHAYALPLSGERDWIGGVVDKQMRVSPFMPLDQQYECRLSQPGDRLSVVIRNLEAGRPVFQATLGLRRLGFSGALLTRAVVAHPPHNMTTLARIYWQALRLRLKGVRRRDREPPRSRAPASKHADVGGPRRLAAAGAGRERSPGSGRGCRGALTQAAPRHSRHSAKRPAHPDPRPRSGLRPRPGGTRCPMPVREHERDEGAAKEQRPEEPGSQPEHEEREAPDQPQPPAPSDGEEPIVPPAGRPRPPE